MKSIYVEKRTVFVTNEDNEKKVTEAKFKLAGLKSGFGIFDHAQYWSLPFEKASEGYDILKSIFNHIRRV